MSQQSRSLVRARAPTELPKLLATSFAPMPASRGQTCRRGVSHAARSCHKLNVKNYLCRNHLAHRTPPQRPAPARTRKSATGRMEGATGSSGRSARRLQAGCRCTASSWSTCLLHLMTIKCPGLLQRANERQRRGTARQDPAAAARQRRLEARKAPWSSSGVSAALTQVIAACGGAGGAEAG